MTSFGDQPQQMRSLAHFQHLSAEGGLNLKKYKRKLEALGALLAPDETVVALSAGLPEGDIRERLLAVTDTRLLLLKDDPWDSVSVDLARIAEIKSRRGFAQGRIDVRMFDGKLTINNVHQGSVGLFAIRAEEARRRRYRADIATAVDPQFQQETLTWEDATQQLPPESPGPPPLAPNVVQPSSPSATSSAAQASQLPGIVRNGEQVQFFTSGHDRERSLSLAISDQRILAILEDGHGNSETVSIELDEISSVSGSKGSIFGRVQIRFAGGERVLGPVTNNMIDPFVSQIRSGIASRRPPDVVLSPKSLPSRASTLSPVEVAEQLEKLASLLDRGLLTPAEFAEQKAKLLGG